MHFYSGIQKLQKELKAESWIKNFSNHPLGYEKKTDLQMCM